MCDAGFVFGFVRDEAGSPEALRGVRHGFGVVDMYTVSAADFATAARYRDGVSGDDEPVWRASGPVLDVLNGLLALPTDAAGGEGVG